MTKRDIFVDNYRWRSGEDQHFEAVLQGLTNSGAPFAVD